MKIITLALDGLRNPLFFGFTLSPLRNTSRFSSKQCWLRGSIRCCGLSIPRIFSFPTHLSHDFSSSFISLHGVQQKTIRPCCLLQWVMLCPQLTRETLPASLKLASKEESKVTSKAAHETFPHITC